MSLYGPIQSDHDFLDRAMKFYDNPSCFTLDEFMTDLNGPVRIKRYLKKYHNSDEVNIRKLINQFVVFYNCFGSAATQLFLYKVREAEYMAIAIPIMAYLGWVIPEYDTSEVNNRIIRDLLEL